MKDEGGHLTHGHPNSFSGQDYEVIDYDIDPATEMLDYEAIREKAPRGPRKVLCVVVVTISA